VSSSPDMKYHVISLSWHRIWRPLPLLTSNPIFSSSPEIKYRVFDIESESRHMGGAVAPLLNKKRQHIHSFFVTESRAVPATPGWVAGRSFDRSSQK
jgi:hypothetical protein